jgi:hypothetical protein
MAVTARGDSRSARRQHHDRPGLSPWPKPPSPLGTAEILSAWNDRSHLERTWQVLDAVREVAAGRDASMGQVAIAWVLARPAVSSVILGARTLDQLNDNLAAADLRLSQEETRLLDKVSEPEAPDCPYGQPGQSQRERRIRGGRFRPATFPADCEAANRAPDRVEGA